MYSVDLRLLANIYKRCVSFPGKFVYMFFEGGRELRRNLALSFPAPAIHRREEELLREDISSLQMIEPFSFIVALARAHYSAINKSDSSDIVPPNDRALRYLFDLYKPQR